MGHTMFPRRFTEAVANSVERTRSHPSSGESRLCAAFIEVDNMKVMWTGGRNLTPPTSTLDCSTQIHQEGLKTSTQSDVSPQKAPHETENRGCEDRILDGNQSSQLKSRAQTASSAKGKDGPDMIFVQIFTQPDF